MSWKYFLSGERFAVFGLHTFESSKLSDYFFVPIIGKRSTIDFLKGKKIHESKSLSPADIKTPVKFNLALGDDETHDFAMAILDRQIEFTNSVRPICIPKQVPLGDCVEEKNDF